MLGWRPRCQPCKQGSSGPTDNVQCRSDLNDQKQDSGTMQSLLPDHFLFYKNKGSTPQVIWGERAAPMASPNLHHLCVTHGAFPPLGGHTFHAQWDLLLPGALALWRLAWVCQALLSGSPGLVPTSPLPGHHQDGGGGLSIRQFSSLGQDFSGRLASQLGLLQSRAGSCAFLGLLIHSRCCFNFRFFYYQYIYQ